MHKMAIGLEALENSSTVLHRMLAPCWTTRWCYLMDYLSTEKHLLGLLLPLEDCDNTCEKHVSVFF